MKDYGRFLWLLLGLGLGAAAAAYLLTPGKPALAANDRFEDYVMCTGPVGMFGKVPLDGVWLLDYRTGRLLGTVIDRNQGTIVGWAEADLVSEFGLAPKQNVHFLMTTGQISQGQAALYVAETTTGKFGVYTMIPRSDQPGMEIRRHDLVPFRQ
jgi:hypothetical protein